MNGAELDMYTKVAIVFQGLPLDTKRSVWAALSANERSAVAQIMKNTGPVPKRLARVQMADFRNELTERHWKLRRDRRATGGYWGERCEQPCPFAFLVSESVVNIARVLESTESLPAAIAFLHVPQVLQRKIALELDAESHDLISRSIVDAKSFDKASVEIVATKISERLSEISLDHMPSEKMAQTLRRFLMDNEGPASTTFEL